MSPEIAHVKTSYPEKFPSRKVEIPDSLAAWIEHYQNVAVTGVRSEAVARKINLHLTRFQLFLMESYGYERISACVKRDVLNWQRHLASQNLAPATVNNHLASLSAFTTWIHAQFPGLFPAGDPAKGIGELALPPLEPRALTDDQVRSLKNVCDRLHRFHELHGRHRQDQGIRIGVRARPLRDRALVFLLLSTGLRREEVTELNLDQVDPYDLDTLRKARRARILRVRGKGKTERTVFLSADARAALANYLEAERPGDAGDGSDALFLSSSTVSARREDGRLSPRAINQILERIGRWHDAEVVKADRKISPLRPHDLRHTFAYRLAKVTGADAYELERRLGHRSQRYIQRYTNPPEDVAASYIEEF
jgi:integrase